MNQVSCQVILARKLRVMSTDYQEQLRLTGVSQALHHHGVMPPHTQAVASALLMGDCPPSPSPLFSSSAYTGWRTALMWIRTVLSRPMVGVWAYVCPGTKPLQTKQGVSGVLCIYDCAQYQMWKWRFSWSALECGHWGLRTATKQVAGEKRPRMVLFLVCFLFIHQRQRGIC